MALVTCKECGQQISRKAGACPHCGAPGKRRTSTFTIVVAVFAGIWFLAYIALALDPERPAASGGGQDNQPVAPTASSPAASQGPPLHEAGETVSVGYTSYAVWDAWYSDRMSDKDYVDEPPNATYLFVDVTVRNDDAKARTIPPFHLVDGNGAEYSTTTTWGVDNSLGSLESLNPDVERRGVIVFDVPKGRDYRLKVAGGFWSSEDAFIELDPREG